MTTIASATAIAAWASFWPGEGLQANHKKLYRIHREEGLAVRRQRGRKRATSTRRPMVLLSGPNQRWSLDSVSDALTDERRIRMLCLVDDFTHEAPAITVSTSLSGVRVGRELGQIIALGAASLP